MKKKSLQLTQQSAFASLLACRLRSMSPHHFLRYWCYCVVCLNKIIPRAIVYLKEKMQHEGAVKLSVVLTRLMPGDSCQVPLFIPGMHMMT